MHIISLGVCYYYRSNCQISEVHGQEYGAAKFLRFTQSAVYNKTRAQTARS